MLQGRTQAHRGQPPHGSRTHVPRSTPKPFPLYHALPRRTDPELSAPKSCVPRPPANPALLHAVSCLHRGLCVSLCPAHKACVPCRRARGRPPRKGCLPSIPPEAHEAGSPPTQGSAEQLLAGSWMGTSAGTSGVMSPLGDGLYEQPPKTGWTQSQWRTYPWLLPPKSAAQWCCAIRVIRQTPRKMKM